MMFNSNLPRDPPLRESLSAFEAPSSPAELFSEELWSLFPFRGLLYENKPIFLAYLGFFGLPPLRFAGLFVPFTNEFWFLERPPGRRGLSFPPSDCIEAALKYVKGCKFTLSHSFQVLSCYDRTIAHFLMRSTHRRDMGVCFHSVKPWNQPRSSYHHVGMARLIPWVAYSRP